MLYPALLGTKALKPNFNHVTILFKFGTWLVPQLYAGSKVSKNTTFRPFTSIACINTTFGCICTPSMYTKIKALSRVVPSHLRFLVVFSPSFLFTQAYVTSGAPVLHPYEMETYEEMWGNGRIELCHLASVLKL